MKIIAYAFEADIHCIACAKQRFATPLGFYSDCDENTIPNEQEDNEGNPIHPIFSTDEQLQPLYCGDCHEEI